MLASRRKSGMLVPALVLLGLVGCGGSGGEIDRHPVRGSVTLEGEPLASGMIQFLPSDPTKGFPSSTQITNGQYALDRASGLAPADYKVIITSTGASAPAQATPDEPPGGEVPPPLPNIIPAMYNSESTLSVTIEPGENIKDFPLKK